MSLINMVYCFLIKNEYIFVFLTFLNKNMYQLLYLQYKFFIKKIKFYLTI